MTVVKICGIREPLHAIEAADAGADMIGMVFAPSPRQVTLDKAREIVAILRKRYPASPRDRLPVEVAQTYSPLSKLLLEVRPTVVGVFVNEPVDQINRIADDCPLDAVQLSGDEQWQSCGQITRPVIKAIHVEAGNSPREILSQVRLLHGVGCCCLLDTKVAGVYGGTGETFGWGLARHVSKRSSFILAGGLTPENVGEALKLVKPWGVDVSSGVETNGVKDIFKIRMFIDAVRGAG
ncbi:MAG: phosphoribosylanthranilate isomerase [Chloroflexi bacterium]|nr:phosphoribosylanthranilate isomerase [Chloroflexota bacterium]